MAIAWQVELRKMGNPLPVTDLIIAAQALNNNLTLVAKDRDFKMLKDKIAKKLKLEFIE
ncbi:hypothetical protein QPL79_05410 [Ignisphaera sp. 4213-co]|uniref:PIN domain-containing protein n=1 Tax=Ignisphaera cupida TaxID=3050454 RepID=A0ABD4Z933_9CREN|nr:PIN domain-containing protein [Ignisphaera sp. 4213-co]MDK6028795.1 hypothetical protein [Ignisphaera sp. 4213-co]